MIDISETRLEAIGVHDDCTPIGTTKAYLDLHEALDYRGNIEISETFLIASEAPDFLDVPQRSETFLNATDVSSFYSVIEASDVDGPALIEISETFLIATEAPGDSGIIESTEVYLDVHEAPDYRGHIEISETFLLASEAPDCLDVPQRSETFLKATEVSSFYSVIEASDVDGPALIEISETYVDITESPGPWVEPPEVPMMTGTTTLLALCGVTLEPEFSETSFTSIQDFDDANESYITATTFCDTSPPAEYAHLYDPLHTTETVFHTLQHSETSVSDIEISQTMTYLHPASSNDATSVGPCLEVTGTLFESIDAEEARPSNVLAATHTTTLYAQDGAKTHLEASTLPLTNLSPYEDVNPIFSVAESSGDTRSDHPNSCTPPCSPKNPKVEIRATSAAGVDCSYIDVIAQKKRVLRDGSPVNVSYTVAAEHLMKLLDGEDGSPARPSQERFGVQEKAANSSSLGGQLICAGQIRNIYLS